MRRQDARQDLLGRACILLVGLPDEDAFLKMSELILHRPVQAREEQGLEAEVVEHSGVGLTVTECIDNPADARPDSELLLEEAVAHVHVGDNILVIRVGQVSGRPAALGDLQLTALDQVFHLILLLLVELFVP